VIAGQSHSTLEDRQQRRYAFPSAQARTAALSLILDMMAQAARANGPGHARGYLVKKVNRAGKAQERIFKLTRVWCERRRRKGWERGVAAREDLNGSSAKGR